MCAVTDVPEAADLSVSGDTLAGGEGDVTRWTVALTEPALNAAVDNGRGCWGRLEMLHMKVRVLQAV